jgi:transposase
MTKLRAQISVEIFEKHVKPYLSTAKRGFVSRIGLEKIFNAILRKLNTGCQWKELEVEEESGKSLTYQAVYWHYRKWAKDGSLDKVWEHSLEVIREQLDFSELNVDGNQTPAKKGGN